MSFPWRCTLLPVLLFSQYVAGYHLYDWFNSSVGLSSTHIQSKLFAAITSLQCREFCLSFPNCWSIEWSGTFCYVYDTSGELEALTTPNKIYLAPHSKEKDFVTWKFRGHLKPDNSLLAKEAEVVSNKECFHRCLTEYHFHCRSVIIRNNSTCCMFRVKKEEGKFDTSTTSDEYYDYVTDGALEWTSYKVTKLTGQSFYSSTSGVTLERCFRNCMEDTSTQCMSVRYNSTDHQGHCQLSTQSLSGNQELLTHDLSADSYELVQTIWPKGDCIDGTWTQRGRYCYKAFYSSQTAFDAARSECQSLSTDESRSDLVSIEEALFVAHLIRSEQTVTAYLFGCWIGLERTNSEWRWLDGNPSNFTKWVSPPGETTDRLCAFIWVTSDAWGTTSLCSVIGLIAGRVCKASLLALGLSFFITFDSCT
ncbi:hypothetical protein CAPTEDRAFT_198629 [Capitella teleta]|uniref:C-type lectin domain-containing protein n=1 Tax=Capitella teleta TaxID=283909 RepID=R7UZN9_CAPTE|nr:hypothetical protein CAPTEDRAFT_198629 [Capitella teleta]|eukprot:ELU11754.1 hypothetical protein CAPTEDRAFT_198629 [Capitella teleta]